MNNQIYQGGGELTKVGSTLGSVGSQMGGSFGAYGALAQGVFSIVDALANPPQIMKQPIITKEAALAMGNPYTNGNGQSFATGGSVPIQDLFGNINSEFQQELSRPNIYEEQYNTEEEPVKVDVVDDVNNDTDDSFIGFNLNDLTSTASKSLFTPTSSFKSSNDVVPATKGSSTNRIIAKESGGDYKLLPRKKDGSLASSAVGKYQFLWNTHKGDIEKVTGVKSKEEFRNNPQAQEQYYSHWKANTLEPRAKALINQVKKHIPSITMDDMELMIHFAGEGNINKAIKTGNFNVPLDAYGTTINKYIGKKYAMGGTINIKPENRGKFTAAAKKAGMGVQAYAKKVLADPNASATLKKRANFARNAAKWYAFGGTANNVPIEIEGQEVLETPDGQVFQAQGPNHENGGIDIAVPNGTDIYSNRLKVDGKTMQERKLIRERAIAKLDKLLSNNPADKLLKNSASKMKAKYKQEDAEDMDLQNAYKEASEFATGGTAGPYPVDLNYDINDFMFADGTALPLFMNNNPVPAATNPLQTQTVNPISVAATKPVQTTVPNPELNQGSGFSLGDTIGMAGNIFNGIAPILNTINAAKASKPNVNRFRGFGRDALDTNTQMQEYIDSIRDNQIADVNSATNAQIAANNNSASGISTARALNIATQINKQKALQGVNNEFTSQMLGILAQRTGLQNQRDQVEMQGETQRDLENKRDTDNFYSNMAQNLVNLGSNVQGLARNINKSESNKRDTALINSLAVNNIAVTKDGRILNKDISAADAAKLVSEGKYKWNDDFTALIPVRKIGK